MEDKFELKEKLIKVFDELNRLGGMLMEKVTDEEAGEIRARVMGSLEETARLVKDEICNIY